MKTAIGLIMFFMAALPLHAGKNIEWKHVESVTVLSQEWVVTQPAGTVMVPVREPVPCPPPPVVIPPSRGTDSTIYSRVCSPTYRMTSIPVQAPEKGRFEYRLETPMVIYTIGSMDRLNVTIKGTIQFGWDTKNVYLVQDDGRAAQVFILRKEAK